MPTLATLPESRFTELLRAHNFRVLFRDELGWDNPTRAMQPFTLTLPTGEAYTFSPVVEKRGFQVLLCEQLPAANVRRTLDELVRKRVEEHLLIFTDPAGDRQLWQFEIRDLDKTRRQFVAEYHHHQTPRLLWQRVSGMAFSMEEEDDLTLPDVRRRVQEQLATNAEAVTKDFYKGFATQHKAFMQQIQGLPAGADDDRRWYASLMLNRLMFLYFIQAQGYLLSRPDDEQGDPQYLKTKFAECQRLRGKDKFFSFYQSFLRRLFHEALNQPEPHDAALQQLIGRVPYLNGGLFEQHQLEVAHPQLFIPDEAFKPLLDFLSTWTWHLDTRITATGKHINPDVLGYIFERYINERAAMGAYYTKEDVTGYIARNCIVPALFDRIAAHAPHESEVWNLLIDAPRRYLYPAQLHGIEHELPTEIEAGRTNVAARAPHWNKTTPPQWGLPTEIWRETIARRQRTFDTLERLGAGQVRSINDLITLNLNVRQFLHDAIHNSGNPEWVWACFEALRTLTVLDPTCGSGAFLFAALGILEPLYEACLDRMEAFLPELDNAKALPTKKKVVQGMKDVRDDLATHHQNNREYFITKSIILRNLYGVDLMHEAVEIAKLRLFLQLMATLGEPDYAVPNMGLEPLPDVDFNIRAGNTLVGIANKAELKDGGRWGFFGEEIPLIEEEAETLSRALARYRSKQIDAGDAEDLNAAKTEAKERLKKLITRCNQLLHKQNSTVSFKEFCRLYAPFHWFAEYYEIITLRGGFDVIIGNPPYVEYSKVRKIYEVKGLSTVSCGNIYAPVMERSYQVSHNKSYLGMIIPISFISTPRMAPIHKLWSNKGQLWVSSYAVFPQTLFEGVHQRLNIVILAKESIENNRYNASRYHKWLSDERPHILNSVSYAASAVNKAGLANKTGSKTQADILKKVNDCSNTMGVLSSGARSKILYYKNTGINNWIVATTFSPACIIDGHKTPSSRETYFKVSTEAHLSLASCIVNSSLFYLYYTSKTNGRDLNPSDLNEFRLPNSLLNTDLKDVSKRLQKDLNRNSTTLVRNQKQTGIVEIQSFHAKQSKEIIDEIDTILAQHYGFTDEELDFIINYDIKYRMGAELEADD